MGELREAPPPPDDAEGGHPSYDGSHGGAKGAGESGVASDDGCRHLSGAPHMAAVPLAHLHPRPRAVRYLDQRLLEEGLLAGSVCGLSEDAEERGALYREGGGEGRHHAARGQAEPVPLRGLGNRQVREAAHAPAALHGGARDVGAEGVCLLGDGCRDNGLAVNVDQATPLVLNAGGGLHREGGGGEAPSRLYLHGHACGLGGHDKGVGLVDSVDASGKAKPEASAGGVDKEAREDSSAVESAAGSHCLLLGQRGSQS
eukprot:CAMPEP_0114123538 /NCGR_PEP_ID=MMETSP0043_2-20121206/8271_1 /TAXON_ID=464988 /ORGANISM="Hemiselmis andersenii, Strain CCMP644" /LENGTH=257 /DNA_ID=CAMNT_0001216305 /DNA_START=278 /DNA_END=1051 /DNA_ORIENTATION=+